MSKHPIQETPSSDLALDIRDLVVEYRTAGSVAQVYLRGTLAVDHGKVLAGPDGQFIPRGKCQL